MCRNERMLTIDFHPDEYHPPHGQKVKARGRELEILSPAFFGCYGGVFPFKPIGFSVGWVEPDEKERVKKQWALENWDIVEDAEAYEADHVDIDVDGLAKWDDSLEHNVAFIGKFSNVPAEMAERSFKHAKTLSLVEILHGCGNSAYKEWCLGKQAWYASAGIVKRFGKAFKPDSVYVIMDGDEMKRHYGTKAEYAVQQFMVSVGHGLRELGIDYKFRVVDRGEEFDLDSFAERQMDIYEEVQKDAAKGKLMMISNTHAASWFTKPKKFTFARSFAENAVENPLQ